MEVTNKKLAAANSYNKIFSLISKYDNENTTIKIVEKESKRKNVQESIIDMYEQTKLKQYQIAKILGIHPSAVSRTIKKYNKGEWMKYSEVMY